MGPYLPAGNSVTSPNHHQFLNEMDSTPVKQTNSFSRNTNGGNMKTFAAVSVESTITHVTSHSNNTLNNVVTTIAAQVNPPYTTADVLTTSASVNDNVFKSSNLDEEDLQVKLCSQILESGINIPLRLLFFGGFS